jgi:hypothetical protein
MRTLLTFVGVVLGVILGVIIGYELAAHRYTELNLVRENHLQREIALLFTVVVDIAEHQNDGQTDLAQWKFTELRNSLEHYLRGGGPDPTEFVPDIVEVTQIPSRDEQEESD